MLDTKELWEQAAKERRANAEWLSRFPSVYQIEFRFNDSRHAHIQEKRNILAHDQEKAVGSFVRQCVPVELQKYLNIVSLQYICRLELIDEEVHKGLFENWWRKILVRDRIEWLKKETKKLGLELNESDNSISGGLIK